MVQYGFPCLGGPPIPPGGEDCPRNTRNDAERDCWGGERRSAWPKEPARARPGLTASDWRAVQARRRDPGVTAPPQSHHEATYFVSLLGVGMLAFFAYFSG